MDDQTPATANQPLEIPAEIRSFLEGLMQDAGILTDDGSMKEEMIKELFVRLDHFINAAIIESLPPEQLDVFVKLNEEKKPKVEIEQFLKDKIPNVQEVFAKAFADFREMYLGNTTLARSAEAKAPEKKTN